jgi:hypothetical protein
MKSEIERKQISVKELIKQLKKLDQSEHVVTIKQGGRSEILLDAEQTQILFSGSNS